MVIKHVIIIENEHDYITVRIDNVNRRGVNI